VPPRIKFCGAARTVTGSRHLIEIGEKRVLVDCGLFQGPREIRERNWQPFPVEPSSLYAGIVTHAHTDHIGWIPRLVAQGYEGPLYATRATIGLCGISLPDSGRLQEEDARHRNRHNISRHHPALPLYTEKEAFACLKQFQSVRYGEFQKLPGGAQFRFLPAGHILGSAFAEIYFENGERLLMSGDLGRYDTPIIKDPTAVDFAEYLVIESTYGDRIHSNEDPEKKLEGILNDAWRDGSCVLVPSFAIGRTQELLYLVKKLQDEARIPRMPVFVDSPMATSTSALYRQQSEEHDAEAKIAFEGNDDPMAPELLQFIRDSEDSKALNVRKGPMMILSGSGMCEGGRILHHLLHRLEDPSTMVVFTGYQAEGTRGRKILEGAPEVQIFRQQVAVRARIEKMNSLSAHADQAEMLKWLSNFKSEPKRTFIVHGEPPAQEALRSKILDVLGWRCEIPEHLQEFELS
jgi:metallo-beta-lactamase family protein